MLAMGNASAYVDHFLHGTILGTLSRSQADTFIRTFKEVLSDTPDGGKVSLQIPADGRRAAIEGSLTLQRTKVENGERCRQMRTEVKRGSQKEGWVGWFCKQANGEWKAKRGR